MMDSMAGSVVGTPAYLAPEVIRADDNTPYNPQVTLWSPQTRKETLMNQPVSPKFSWLVRLWLHLEKTDTLLIVKLCFERLTGPSPPTYTYVCQPLELMTFQIQSLPVALPVDMRLPCNRLAKKVIVVIQITWNERLAIFGASWPMNLSFAKFETPRYSQQNEISIPFKKRPSKEKSVSACTLFAYHKSFFLVSKDLLHAASRHLVLWSLPVCFNNWDIPLLQAPGSWQS